jgi:hypothetical protein
MAYGYGCVVQYQLRGAISAAWGNIICVGQYWLRGAKNDERSKNDVI